MSGPPDDGSTFLSDIAEKGTEAIKLDPAFAAADGALRAFMLVYDGESAGMSYAGGHVPEYTWPRSEISVRQGEIIIQLRDNDDRDGEAAQMLARRKASLAGFREETTRNEGGIFRAFTAKARQVILIAQKHAQMRNSEHIGTEHLLLGVTDIGKADLKALGITPEDLRQEIVDIIGPAAETPPYQIPWTPGAKSALRLSAIEAKQFGKPVRPAHLLLGLIGADAARRTVAARVLAGHGVTPDSARRHVARQT